MYFDNFVIFKSDANKTGLSESYEAEIQINFVYLTIFKTTLYCLLNVFKIMMFQFYYKICFLTMADLRTKEFDILSWSTYDTDLAGVWQRQQI